MLSFSPVVGIGTPPTPYPQVSVPPPPLWFSGEGHTRRRERESPNSDVGTYTVVLFIYMCFVAIRILTAQGTVWGELPVRLRPLRPRGGGRRTAGVWRSRFAVSHGVHDGDAARSPERLLPVSRLREEGATRDTSTVQKREF